MPPDDHDGLVMARLPRSAQRISIDVFIFISDEDPAAVGNGEPTRQLATVKPARSTETNVDLNWCLGPGVAMPLPDRFPI